MADWVYFNRCKGMIHLHCTCVYQLQHLNGKKIIIFMKTTFAVAKRKPEKYILFNNEVQE